MKASIIISLKMLLFMTVLTGLIYPLFILLVGQVIFPFRSNGSMITVDNKFVGSELIGQKFVSSKYFFSRPSAIDYNPLPSGGSNLSVTSQILKENTERRKFLFDSINGLNKNIATPDEMIYASGSGLDPHISLKAVNLQFDRICKVRNLSEKQKKELKNLIENLTENRQLGILGEKRINVLKLNIELDNLSK
jgi:potassium-transporting ATPase KdpC subunit